MKNITKKFRKRKKFVMKKLTEYIILCYNYYEKVPQTEKIRNGGYFYGDKKRLLSKRTYR